MEATLLGRGRLLATIEDRLGPGGGVALHGPAGIGKTAILDAVAVRAASRGDLVVRLRPVRVERSLPYAGIADLVAQLPDTGALPPAQRAALAALRQGLPPRAGSPALSRRLVLPLLLARCARTRTVLLVLDDCQWLDPASAELIAFAMRHRPGPRVRVLAAQRRPDPAGQRHPGLAALRHPDLAELRRLDSAAQRRLDPAAQRHPDLAALRRLDPAAQRHPDPAGQRRLDSAGQRRRDAGGQRRAARLCPAPVLELAVPPMDADDLTALLEARGLPCRTASRMHEASAGNPFLALALGGALAPGPAWRPAPIPETVRDLLREGLTALPGEVLRTLRTAALATDPTTTLLIRAGREDAVRDLRLAAAAGVIGLDGDAIRFVPPLLAGVIAEDASAAERAAVHAALAAGAVDPVQALRHRALRSGRPDATVARSLALAAERHSGRAAAELYLLAADRCPHTLASLRLDWLVEAARTAITGGAAALAGRAAEAVIAADAPAGHRVRARLVLLDLAGQGLAEMGETFAAALAEAGDDPALLAPIRLRLTWAAFLAGDFDEAAAEAGRAASAARLAGDPTAEAMALCVLAQVQRLRGMSWSDTLGQALALPATPSPDWLHYGPRYMAARFAMVDDRLDEARAELLKLLAIAEDDRIGEARVEVLRSLSEVATRAGRCREALRYAHRAVDAAQDAGLSPGPTWYTAAVAELAGGSLAAAAGFARRGVRASEQEGDRLYLRRNLHALGQASLRAGETRAGVEALRRLRDLEAGSGAADPMIVRWHGDLAGGLAVLGEHDAAAAVLAEARVAVGGAVSAYLDRATAVVLSERGEADSAVVLSAAAARRFEELRQPIEQAHSLLVQGGAERRRRRYAAARVAIGAALAIFLAADAKPWAEQTSLALARTSAAGFLPGFTPTELKIATLVRDGATNREIASRLYLSVKTVEATLTRVYRKLGVRSRTQLSSRLSGPSVSEFTPGP